MKSEKIRACDISDFDYEKLTLRMASPFCGSRPSNITFLEHRIILGLISVCQQNKILIGSIYCKIYISNLAVLIQSDKTSTLNALDKLIKNREKKCLMSKNKVSVPWFDDIFIDEKKQYLYFKFNMSLMLLFLPAPLFEKEK